MFKLHQQYDMWAVAYRVKTFPYDKLQPTRTSAEEVGGYVLRVVSIRRGF
jgi:hypothetical protein